MEGKSAFSFRKGDGFAVALVLLLAVAAAMVFLPGGDGQNAVVQIRQDGVLLEEYPLGADAQFEVGGLYTNRVVIRDGRVCIEESDCPGGDCVHSGWISDAGRSLVCLPNRVEICILGRSDVDFAVR